MFLDVVEVYHVVGEALACEPKTRSLVVGADLEEILVLLLRRSKLEFKGERPTRWYAFYHTNTKKQAEFTAHVEGDNVVFQLIDHG